MRITICNYFYYILLSLLHLRYILFDAYAFMIYFLDDCELKNELQI